MPITSYGSSVSISVATSSAATALPDGQGGRVELVNLGPGTVYVKLGTSNSVSVAAIDGTARNSQVVPVNCVLELDTSSATHIATIGTVASTLIVMQGG